MPAKAENVVIISGSQQGPDLMGRIFLDEGDTVLVENPTFLGALQSFNAYGVRYAAVPLDEQGLCVDELEGIIERTHPKFMYLIPTFQNPTGVTMSLERRRQVVEIADRLGVPILEDDPYGPLRFAGEPLPTLLALDAARFPKTLRRGVMSEGNVVYLSTFSKTLAPGLRVAWAVCPPEIAQQFVMAKQGATCTPTPWRRPSPTSSCGEAGCPRRSSASATPTWSGATPCARPSPNTSPRRCTTPSRRAACSCGSRCPAIWTRWSCSRRPCSSKVAFVPGSPFFVDGSGRNTLRLSFASVPPETIREGRSSAWAP